VSVEKLRASELVPDNLKCLICRKLLQDGVWIQPCDRVSLSLARSLMRWHGAYVAYTSRGLVGGWLDAGGVRPMRASAAGRA
jgi:hypothetical protein